MILRTLPLSTCRVDHICVKPLHTCVVDEPGRHDDEQHGGTSLNPTVVQPVGSARSGTDLPPTDCPVQSTDRTGTGWSPGHQDQPPGCPCGHDADEHGRCVVSYPPQIKCFTVYDIQQAGSAAPSFHVESCCCRPVSVLLPSVEVFVVSSVSWDFFRFFSLGVFEFPFPLFVYFFSANPLL